MAPSLCDYLAFSSKRLMLTNGALLGERLSFCKLDHSFHKSPSKSSAVRPENCLVDLVLAEGRLIPFEAKALQPTPDIHHGHPNPSGEHN
jgi:hypothetical protein